MPAFKRFGPDDQIDNVLVLQPEYTLVSGTAGWSGSPEGSASLFLYGGARRRPGVFSQIEYQSFAPNVSQTGNPTRGQPLTASVSLAMARNEPLNISLRSDTRWGEEHWDVLRRLYEDYRPMDPDYVTGSYDHYCLYFRDTSRNVVACELLNAGSLPIVPTGSFLLESWVKPFLTGSGPSTIQSMNRNFWFGLTGSNGLLMLSGTFSTHTSSVTVPVRRWSHVAVSYDSSTLTGTFYINLQFAGTFVSPSASFVGAEDAYYSIGNKLDNVGSSDFSQGFAQVTGTSGWSFDGFIGETRVWHQLRSFAEVSSSAFHRLTGSELTGPVSCFQFTEGPLAKVRTYSFGSGALDYSGRALGRGGDRVIGELRGFSDRVGPVWHPSDNVSFFVPKQLVPLSLTYADASSQAWGPTASDEVRRMLVIDVPSAFYGRQVVPGSVRMTCRAFEQFGLVRTLVDDTRGGLFLSGSACSSSLETREDYAGVGWNKVGNVFYGEGLVVIRDPALLDFGRDDGAFNDPSSTLGFVFRGDSRIPVKTLMCRVDHGEFNCTTNPTFFVTGSAGERLVRHPSGSIRVTSVGIYNSNRELVAVARLADPVRIRARDRMNIRIRMDF